MKWVILTAVVLIALLFGCEPDNVRSEPPGEIWVAWWFPRLIEYTGEIW